MPTKKSNTPFIDIIIFSLLNKLTVIKIINIHSIKNTLCEFAQFK